VDLRSRLEQLLRLEFAHEDELARVAESDTAPSAGAWRAADYLAHFSLWRRLFLDHVRSALAGSNPPTPPEDLDAVNERQLALDRQSPAGELVMRWRRGYQEMLDFVQACGTDELDHAPEWYGAATVAAAVVRNSYTHPCGHLVDFHFERGRVESAAELAEEMADVVNELSDLDSRFPAGTYAFRGFALALRARPDDAMDALKRAVALRPVLGPMLGEEAALASLRGRPDFEAMTRPGGIAPE
jgi:tetratricopeptide (TPR) repeat protein